MSESAHPCTKCDWFAVALYSVCSEAPHFVARGKFVKGIVTAEVQAQQEARIEAEADTEDGASEPRGSSESPLIGRSNQPGAYETSVAFEEGKVGGDYRMIYLSVVYLPTY
jgi:hypothetical protein